MSLSFLVVCFMLGQLTLPAPVNGDTPSCPYKECVCSGVSIDCAHKGLSTLPQLLQNSTGNYTHLYLNDNNLTHIGEGGLPGNLESLVLLGNPIENISKSAFLNSSQTLKSISFSEASFDSLPDALKILDNIETLVIKNTNLTTYPDTVLYSLAKSLTSLVLSNVGFNALPTWLDRFVILHQLNLEDNPMGSPPDHSFDTWAKELSDLNLHNIGATQLTAVQNLEVLKKLNASKNKISDHILLTYDLIPSSDTLESVDLSSNLLTQLPRLAGIIGLTYATFKDNKMTTDNKGALPESLTHLNLDENSFSEIPDSIKGLSNLEEFSISNNEITKLGPHEFPATSQLKSLKLSSNPITTIDEYVFNGVQQLTHLYLANTSLSSLPLALAKLDNLIHLSMEANDQLTCSCREKAVVTLIVNNPGLKVYGKCAHEDINKYVTHLFHNCP